MADKLAQFARMTICPSCAALNPDHILKCAECGHFAMALEVPTEIEAPTPVERKPLPPKEVDPSFYSRNPLESIPEEIFEGDEEIIVEWDGSSADFSFEE